MFAVPSYEMTTVRSPNGGRIRIQFRCVRKLKEINCEVTYINQQDAQNSCD